MMVADEVCVLGEHEQQLMWKVYVWTVAKLTAHVVTCFRLLSNMQVMVKSLHNISE
jgi:hypothetical protein